MDRRSFLRTGLWGGGIATVVGLHVVAWKAITRRGELPSFPSSMREPPGTTDRDVRTIAFSLSGNQLVSVTADREMSLWNSKTEKVLFTRPSPHRGGATDVSLFNDGGWLAAVSEDQFLSIWNSGERSGGADLFRLESEPSAVAFSPTPSRGRFYNSVFLAVSQEDHTVRIFEYNDPNSSFVGTFNEIQQDLCCGQQFVSPDQGFRQMRVLRPKYGGTTSLAFSRDGHVLAVASGHDYLQVWATRDWSQFVIPTRLSSPLHSLAFSSDSRLVATGAEDGTVVVSDWRNEGQIARLEGHGSIATDLVFCDDDKWIIAGYADGVIKIWPRRDATQGFIVGENPGKHTSLSISADGRQLASSWGMQVKFWETSDLVALARKTLS